MTQLINKLPIKINNGSSFICQFDHCITDDDIISIFKDCNYNIDKINNHIIDQISQYMTYLTIKNYNRYQYYYTDIEYIERILHNKNNSKYLYLLIIGSDGFNLVDDDWSLEYELQQLFANKYNYVNKSSCLLIDYVSWN